MWVFTSVGFISVVQSRIDENHLIVRGRREEDLKNLFPRNKAHHTPDADYPYRMVMPRVVFIAVMLDQISKITYDKFKPSAKGTDYHDFLIQVWGRGLDYEDSESRVPRPDSERDSRGAYRMSSRDEDI